MDEAYHDCPLTHGRGYTSDRPLPDVASSEYAGHICLEQVRVALGVQASKLSPLLYALVVGPNTVGLRGGLLTVEDDLFSNTAEAIFSS